MPNYTTQQAADKLGISAGRVRQLAIAAGDIGTHFGRDWLFTDEDIARLDERRKDKGPAPGPNSKRKRTSRPDSVDPARTEEP